MTNLHSIQTVLDEAGRPVSVIVPIELWRQIAPNTSTPTDAQTRAQIWQELLGSMKDKLGTSEEFYAERREEVARELAREDARDAGRL